jgi:hypothetical protein
MDEGFAGKVFEKVDKDGSLGTKSPALKAKSSYGGRKDEEYPSYKRLRQ